MAIKYAIIRTNDVFPSEPVAVLMEREIHDALMEACKGRIRTKHRQKIVSKAWAKALAALEADLQANSIRLP